MENLDFPPPPPLKSRMGKWRVFALCAASSLIWGRWGFSVPFYFNWPRLQLQLAQMASYKNDLLCTSAVIIFLTMSAKVLLLTAKQQLSYSYAIIVLAYTKELEINSCAISCRKLGISACGINLQATLILGHYFATIMCLFLVSEVD